MKASKRLYNGFGLAGIALCAACCALPIFGVMLGAGTLSVLSRYVEWAGMVAIALSAIFFGVYVLRRKKSTACEPGCECKSDNTLTQSKAG